VKKAQKPNPTLGIEGGIVQMEKPIDASNVMVIDPKSNKPSRVGFKIDEKTGKKTRIFKKSAK
jgi:large subunit ribosomal protein L24